MRVVLLPRRTKLLSLVARVGCGLGGVFFSSRRRHTRLQGDWSSDVCSSDLGRSDLFESSQSPKKQDVTIPQKRSLRPLALGALSGVALLIVILMVTRPWGNGAQDRKSVV